MNKYFLRKVGVLLAIFVFVTAFSGCTKKNEVSKLDSIKKSGKIVLGTSADYPPYEFHKNVDGKDTIVGFDIEIAKEIARDLGVELEIKEMKFDGLLAALSTGNVDFVIAGMNPTEDRKANTDFSEIYYKAVQCIVVRDSDKDSIKELVNLDGKRIGVQKGSIQEGIANEKMKNSQIVSLGKVSDLILALKSNRVDAVIVEAPVANAYTAKNSDMYVSGIKVENGSGEEGSAVAVKKGNIELVKEINKTLNKLLENKTIDSLVTKATEEIE